MANQSETISNDTFKIEGKTDDSGNLTINVMGPLPITDDQQEAVRLVREFLIGTKGVSFSVF